MAYEVLGEIRVVQLGGINKNTGKKNPTEVEGYYIGQEKRANKFNPAQPKNFYKFQTAEGDIGMYASAGLDKVMRGATLGLMTKIVATGEVLDTGKGNPMKLFKAFQDKTNTLDVSELSSESTVDATEETDSYDAVDEDDGLVAEEQAAPTRPTPPRVAVAAPDPAKQAKIQALLNKSRSVSR